MHNTNHNKIERCEEGIDLFGFSYITFKIHISNKKRVIEMEWILYITPKE